MNGLMVTFSNVVLSHLVLLQADAAILVVDATRGEFETGFESGGQTREHALLVRSLGVKQLVVGVNKLDTVGWAEDRFREIVKKLGVFLKQVGFKVGNLSSTYHDSYNLSLCKFRCGNHKLPVAKCRYLSDQPMEMCPLCNLNVQGDEFHYVLVCPVLNDVRKRYVKKYHYTRPNVLKFHQLFNTTSVKQLKNLSKFCRIIMSKFG